MRIAVLSDIHGNLPAFEAVLPEVRRERVDQIVIGGDVLVGPMSREVLTELVNLDIPVRFLYGNCEVAVMQAMADKLPSTIPEQYREWIRWTAEQVRSDYETMLASWPKTITLDVPGVGDVLFCHGTPRDENEIITQVTPEDRVMSVLEGVAARIVVCGHTHMQYDRMIGRTRVVNAGSVGMPFGEPGADWLLLGPDVQLRHTDYDVREAAARVRATAYPGAEEFASKYVLNPPTAAEMLELYSGVQAR
jgi:putative phosphoesterase